MASVGFIKYNVSTTRISKEKNFKIKFQVILVFYRTSSFTTTELSVSSISYTIVKYMLKQSGACNICPFLDGNSVFVSLLIGVSHNGARDLDSKPCLKRLP